MFPPFGFSIQEFFIRYFYVKKQPLYVNFSISPLEIDDLAQGSTPSVGMRFCGHEPNSPRNKNLKRHISYLLEKVVFLEKTIVPLGQGWNFFSFNFECFDLANSKE
jgi:hypothetical protein